MTKKLTLSRVKYLQKLISFYHIDYTQSKLCTKGSGPKAITSTINHWWENKHPRFTKGKGACPRWWLWRTARPCKKSSGRWCTLSWCLCCNNRALWWKTIHAKLGKKTQLRNWCTTCNWFNRSRSYWIICNSNSWKANN